LGISLCCYADPLKAVILAGDDPNRTDSELTPKTVRGRSALTESGGQSSNSEDSPTDLPPVLLSEQESPKKKAGFSRKSIKTRVVGTPD